MYRLKYHYKSRRHFIFYFACFITIVLYRNYHQLWKQNILYHQPEIVDLSCLNATEKYGPVWKIKGTDLFKNFRQIKYLRGYKNPCWFEFLDAPAIDEYFSNPYISLNKSNNYIKVGYRYKQRLHPDGYCPYRLRCLPYFMIIGQPKCATTDLYFRITHHPHVEAAHAKGPHWWTRTKYKNVSFTSYVDCFAEASENIQKKTDNGIHPIITGEASPSTFWDFSSDYVAVAPSVDRKWKQLRNKVAGDIKQVLPQVRLILILRNPVDRLCSDYLFFGNGIKSSQHFHIAVKSSITVFSDCLRRYNPSICAHNSSITEQLKVRLHLGLYSIYLKEWYQIFPKNQILVLKFEDYTHDTINSLRKVFDFLHLQQLDEDEERVITSYPALNINHSYKTFGKILQSTKDLLQKFYSDFNRDLVKLLKNNKFLWKT